MTITSSKPDSSLQAAICAGEPAADVRAIMETTVRERVLQELNDCGAGRWAGRWRLDYHGVDAPGEGEETDDGRPAAASAPEPPMEAWFSTPAGWLEVTFREPITPQTRAEIEHALAGARWTISEAKTLATLYREMVGPKSPLDRIVAYEIARLALEDPKAVERWNAAGIHVDLNFRAKPFPSPEEHARHREQQRRNLEAAKVLRAVSARAFEQRRENLDRGMRGLPKGRSNLKELLG